MDKLLSVVDLDVQFSTDEGDITAVENVSFDLRPGEILGIVGESGSGKSVTAKSLMRLNPSNTILGSNAKITFHDDGAEFDILKLQSEDDLRKVRGDLISMIFQEPMASFAPAIPIGKQMVEQLMLHRDMNKKEARELSISMLDRVGISEPSQRFNQYAFELSGGMRQRAMIATALSTGPKLLIADEPTTALDVTIQAQVIDLMKDLVQEFGMAIIFITHDLGVIAQTADRVAVMYLGRMVEIGSVEEVLLQPKHPYTVGLLNARPRLDALHLPLTPVPGEIPSPLERPSGCVFNTRCSAKIAGRCSQEIPPLISLTQGHKAACFLNEKLAGDTK